MTEKFTPHISEVEEAKAVAKRAERRVEELVCKLRKQIILTEALAERARRIKEAYDLGAVG